MLTCLRVRNFAIIDEIEVELSTGLNVVTGETGAGKSILVDALELVLGGRGKPELVRTGATEAEVEGLFDVSDNEETLQRLRDAGVEVEDEVLVRRVVLASGKTRAYVNGKLATAAQLSTLAAGLTDISSQHEHHSLVEPSRHLGYLDAFAQHEGVVAKVSQSFAVLAEADAKLRELEARVEKKGEREDFLRYQMNEIDEVAPVLGEDVALSEERERLRHAEYLARTAGGAEDAIYARDDALCTTLSRIGGDVTEAAKVDSRLAPLAEQIESARTLLEDASRELGRYAQSVTVDTDRLTEVEDRMDAISRLKRKYGGSIDRVLSHAEKAKSELGDLDDHENRLQVLRSEREKAWTLAQGIAVGLSQSRQRAAAKLGKAISGELASLGMGDAEVTVSVENLEGREGELEVSGARLTAKGIDRVEFLISPNRGEQARPLRKIASGGELSRSMLAIKRVLAGLRPTGLYVFDEVDSGVGGGVAEVIGRKLKDVAKHHQVLCITHLPQIAVFADAHYLVEKAVKDGRTQSDVRRLSEKERGEEIARMLGGLKITKKTRDAAAEMLRSAHDA